LQLTIFELSCYIKKVPRDQSGLSVGGEFASASGAGVNVASNAAQLFLILRIQSIRRDSSLKTSCE